MSTKNLKANELISVHRQVHNWSDQCNHPDVHSLSVSDTNEEFGSRGRKLCSWDSTDHCAVLVASGEFA